MKIISWALEHKYWAGISGVVGMVALVIGILQISTEKEKQATINISNYMPGADAQTEPEKSYSKFSDKCSMIIEKFEFGLKKPYLQGLGGITLDTNFEDIKRRISECDVNTRVEKDMIFENYSALPKAGLLQEIVYSSMDGTTFSLKYIYSKSADAQKILKDAESKYGPPDKSYFKNKLEYFIWNDIDDIKLTITKEWSEIERSKVEVVRIYENY